jgi:hypothetical protein
MKLALKVRWFTAATVVCLGTGYGLSDVYIFEASCTGKQWNCYVNQVVGTCKSDTSGNAPTCVPTWMTECLHIKGPSPGQRNGECAGTDTKTGGDCKIYSNNSCFP